MQTKIHNQQPSALRFARSVRQTFTALLIAAATLATTAQADEFAGVMSRGPDLPSPICDSIDVPPRQNVEAHVYAFGVQIYRWDGNAWVFVAPQATLFADPCYSREVGTHYAGPTWEWKDGSKVVAARVAGCTPYPGAIPWLLLEAVSTSGPGRFTKVSYIQRVNTIGGTAPSEPGAFVGAEARVPYTTEYYLFRPLKH